jgi:small subunit ribosomal protein S21
MSKKSTHVNVKVVPKKDEPVERMIKRFMKKVKKERIIEQVKDRRYYEKPSVTKRKAKLAGIRKWKKHEAEFKRKLLNADGKNNRHVKKGKDNNESR